MKNSKLIEVLSVFDKKEFQRLGLFLQSPYHSGKTPLEEKNYSLYLILKKSFPQFEESAVQKEIIYAELFANEKFRAGRLEKVMSSLFKQIERFIQVETEIHDSSQFRSSLLLSKFYRKRGLQRMHAISLSHLEKLQNSAQGKDKSILFQNYILQHTISDFKAINNNRTDDLNLLNTINALDIYFLAGRLEHTCSLLAQSNFHNRIENEQCLELISTLEGFFTNNYFSKIPLIHLYSFVYKILKSKTDNVETNITNIKKLDKLLNQYKNDLNLYQLKYLHAFNRSMLLYNINLGENDLNSYAFKIYKDHLKNKMLKVDEGIYSANFKNIVSIGLKENAFDWVKQFLSDYKDKIIGTDYPDEVYQFNLANYYFHIKEIDKAHEALSQEYEDLYYKLAAKRLEIKIYFEQQSELLEYKLNAFKQFIHRLSKNKLPEIVRTNNNNFINALKQILSPTNNSKAKRQRIKMKIEQMEAVKDKDWLLAVLSAKS